MYLGIDFSFMLREKAHRVAKKQLWKPTHWKCQKEGKGDCILLSLSCYLYVQLEQQFL